MIGYLRLLLFPFSLLYALVVFFRNWAYSRRLLKSTRFDLPVIVIGNLAVGGTGKSPHTEFLIRLLKKSYKIATLSRGYGRDTKGFLHVVQSDQAIRVGDEPLQFKMKYPEITVAVCEDRVKGVEKLSKNHEVILLDDAFQHRSLKPGLSILLFEYESLFKTQLLLPAGNFRDLYSQRHRADIIIVTKCPNPLQEAMRHRALQRLHVEAPVFFSFLHYGAPYQLRHSGRYERPLASDLDVLLISGIANPAPLYQYVSENSRTVKLLSFPDHHTYTRKNIVTLLETFKGIRSENKLMLTTEKDYQRLKIFTDEAAFPVAMWILPVEVAFAPQDHDRLTSIILQYCEQYKVRR
jgi:tetraacyldisaccharide 4'-kinase